MCWPRSPLAAVTIVDAAKSFAFESNTNKAERVQKIEDEVENRMPKKSDGKNLKKCAKLSSEKF